MRKSKTKWLGEIEGNDKQFCKFQHLGFGCRALLRLLTKSYIPNGYVTITKIISRYAPISENDTTNYINYVCRTTNISAAQTIMVSDAESIIKLCAAIICFENGCNHLYDYFINYLTLIYNTKDYAKEKFI